MIDRIEVVCDDPRHHPAEVETFIRTAPGGEWITTAQLAQEPPVAQTGWADHSRDTGEQVHNYRCKSCPRRRPQQFECTNTTLQWLLNAVAQQGMPQPTVRLLNLLLSNGPEKGR